MPSKNRLERGAENFFSEMKTINKKLITGYVTVTNIKIIP